MGGFDSLHVQYSTLASMQSSARLLLRRTAASSSSSSPSFTPSAPLAVRRLTTRSGAATRSSLSLTKQLTATRAHTMGRSLHTSTMVSDDASTTTADHPQTQAPGLEHQGQQPAPEPQPASIKNDIDPSKLQIINNDTPKTIPHSSTLLFGHTFTDHMLTIPWTHTSGWGNPVIRPYGPLALTPPAPSSTTPRPSLKASRPTATRRATRS